jgi:hypothetical protein
MNTSKRSIRVGVVMAIGAVFFLLALVPLALAGELPSPQQTIQAGQTKARGTLSAARTSIPQTGTAFKSTSVAAQAGVKITATAYRLTSTALARNLRTTGTAVRAGLSAGATEINATVMAIKTSVATKIAPLTDPQTAIEYYGTTVLGITPTVVAARKGTSSDAFKLVQTDIGNQIQKYGVLYGAVTYYGELSNGSATLSYGLGAVRDEELPLSLVTASSAVYSIDVEKTGVLDANSALALAQATFPNLTDYSYIPWVTPRGWAWVATDATGILDTRTTKNTRGWVMLYIVPQGGGKAKVSATVVSGAFLAFIPTK